MDNLKEIKSGQTGKVVAESLNENMRKIYEAINSLEYNLRLIKLKSTSTLTVSKSPAVNNITITANPDAIIEKTSIYKQIINVPITVYCGDKTLRYTGPDNGSDAFAVDLGSSVIYDKSGLVKYATVSARNNNNSLVLSVEVAPSIIGSFQYTFSIIFGGVKYKKTISFMLVNNETENSLNITLSPDTVLLCEALSGGTVSLARAKTKYSAYLGSTDVTEDVTVQKTHAINCDSTINTTNHTVKITSIGITPGNDEGVETFKYTKVGDTEETTTVRPTSGYVQLLFTYTDRNHKLHQVFKNFSYSVSYMGIFKEFIAEDINKDVSIAVEKDFNDRGLLLTDTVKNNLINESRKGISSAITASTSDMVENYYLSLKQEFDALSGKVVSTQESIAEMKTDMVSFSGRVNSAEIAVAEIKTFSGSTAGEISDILRRLTDVEANQSYSGSTGDVTENPGIDAGGASESGTKDGVG